MVIIEFSMSLQFNKLYLIQSNMFTENFLKSHSFFSFFFFLSKSLLLLECLLNECRGGREEEVGMIPLLKNVKNFLSGCKDSQLSS